MLRLLANAYIAYLQHLTSGGRIGAAASQRLGLAQAGALGFYGCGRGAGGMDRLEEASAAASIAHAAALERCTPGQQPAPASPSHSHYPLLPEGAKALERFVGAANRLGGLLSGSQQEALMQVGGRGRLRPAGCVGLRARAPAPCGLRPCTPLSLQPTAAPAAAPMDQQELPKAMTKSSQLLLALAREA